MAIQEPSTAGALLTVQTVNVVAAPAILTAIMLHPGSAASTVTVYDSNSSTTSGKTVLAVLQGAANGATAIIPFDSGVLASQGLTAVVAGTGAQAQLYFQRES